MGASKTKNTERDRTDERLGTERTRTDDELTRSRSLAEVRADGVVDKARQRADAVLAKTRRRADARHVEMSRRNRSKLAAERKAEDTVITSERALADRTLNLERAEQRLIVAGLLANERAATDVQLQRERSRADAASRKRDDFFGVVAHEAQSIALGAALNAEMLLESTRSGAARSADLACAERVFNSTALLRRLIGDLVDLVSIERGMLTVTRRGAAVDQVVRAAWESLKPLADAKGIATRCEVTGDGFMASIDEQRVFQVVANLLSNAIKFTPTGVGFGCVSSHPRGD